MSKRKGVSAEEKRIRMLQIFHEKKEFFQLKELENIAPKEKGIVAQSVKDVVQSLVDDGLVDTDKIGISVYFWSFPSKAEHLKKRKLDDVTTNLAESSNKLKIIQEKIEKAKENREDSDERESALKDIEILEVELRKIQEELKKYSDNDPEILEQMQKEIKAIKEAINRWTDNVFMIKSWVKNKFFIEEKTLNKEFGIPEDLDYINI